MRRHASAGHLLAASTAVLMTAAALVAALLVAEPASAASPATSAVVAAPATAAPAQPDTHRVVTLPTGQRVEVSESAGTRTVRLLPPPTESDGGAAAERTEEPVTVLSAAGHTYVVPVGASPSIGRGVSLARFAVDGSAARPDGLLTKPPRGALFTVTVKGIDRDGSPAEGDLGVLNNVDKTDRFIAGQSFYHGSFAFSVPRGHYSVQSFIATSDADSVSYTLATVPQFFVDHNLTVTLDARKGTRVAVSTPRPSSAVHAELNLQREPVSGLPFTDSLTTFDDTPLFATPTDRVHIGRLAFYPAMRLGDAGGSTDRYLYDLEFPTRGAIPANLKYQVTTDDLATVQAHYASVLPGRTELESRIGGLPWQTVLVGAVGNVTAPSSRTEYVTALPHLLWHQEVDLDPDQGNGRTLATSRVYRPGERDSRTWHNQPMGSGFEQEVDAGQPCPVCRTGDTLSVLAFPHVDRRNDFMLADAATSESLTLYQDGTEVGSSRSGFGSFPLSADPADYELVYDTQTAAPWWPTSTEVTTSWTFSSQERAPDQLPPGWTCGGKLSQRDVRPGLDDGCSFEHILVPHYRAAAGLDGVIPAGAKAQVVVEAAAQRGAAADPLRQLIGEVSYDGGATWTPTRATRLSDSTFRLSYRQPELDQTDGFASLRVTAVGTSGSAVTQTVVHAYPLAPLSADSTPPPVGTTGPGQPAQPACADEVAPPLTRCMVIVDETTRGASAPPAGYGPADLAEAYNLPATGSDALVAVVTPYDNPNLATDLATYRKEFGLPRCSTGSGCLTIVNQNGDGSPLPQPSPDWGLQSAQAVDAVSAICPTCRLLVVEADSSSLSDLATAAAAAADLGAEVIGNGYGTIGEFAGERTFERRYRALGVPFVVAAGDYGYGNGTPLVGSVSYPSASRYAVAVGGTTLVRSQSERGFDESAWAYTTSGCSAYIAKPGWQTDPLCGKRTTADVAAVADPSTAIAVYDTYGYGGWLTAGGTSLATAVVAGVYGLSDDLDGGTSIGQRLYAPDASVYDITSGSNGRCRHTYLCGARRGYDGPSGVGTPNGLTAF